MNFIYYEILNSTKTNAKKSSKRSKVIGNKKIFKTKYQKDVLKKLKNIIERTKVEWK